jgi:hypothetical protein
MEGAPVQGEGKQVNLQEAIPETYRFFNEGPGYAVDG